MHHYFKFRDILRWITQCKLPRNLTKPPHTAYSFIKNYHQVQMPLIILRSKLNIILLWQPKFEWFQKSTEAVKTSEYVGLGTLECEAEPVSINNETFILSCPITAFYSLRLNRLLYGFHFIIILKSYACNNMLFYTKFTGTFLTWVRLSFVRFSEPREAAQWTVLSIPLVVFKN